MKIKDRKGTALTVIKYLVLVIGAVILMFPFIWMALSSLKTLAETVAIPPKWFPASPQWGNYPYAWSLKPFGLYFRNTIWVCILTVAGTLLFSLMGAYAFTIYSFPGKTALFFLFMLTMMVPEEMLIIQNYVTVSKLNLLDTYMAIVLPTLANGFYIFMLKEYFMQMPAALFKSAKIDGCSNWKFLWRVMVPMNKNAIFTIGILAFISEWNAFMWPQIVTQSDEHRMLTNGLMMFRNAASSNYQNLMAASCIVLFPIILLYIIFHKKIIKGVASGGIKG